MSDLRSTPRRATSGVERRHAEEVRLNEEMRSVTDEAGAPNSTNSWATVFLNARAGTIHAGTSQMQRNIVGEQVLGLPKEPRTDAGAWNAKH